MYLLCFSFWLLWLGKKQMGPEHHTSPSAPAHIFSFFYMRIMSLKWKITFILHFCSTHERMFVAWKDKALEVTGFLETCPPAASVIPWSLFRPEGISSACFWLEKNMFDTKMSGWRLTRWSRSHVGVSETLHFQPGTLDVWINSWDKPLTDVLLQTDMLAEIWCCSAATVPFCSRVLLIKWSSFDKELAHICSFLHYYSRCLTVKLKDISFRCVEQGSATFNVKVGSVSYGPIPS